MRAETLGVAQLRSDGNVDGEIRALVGTHQDGTVVWGLGQPTALTDLVLENLISGGNIIIIPDSPGGELQVSVGSILHLRVLAGGTHFRGTVDNNAQVFWDDTGGLNRASLGFPTSDVFLFDRDYHAHDVGDGPEHRSDAVRERRRSSSCIACSIRRHGD